MIRRIKIICHVDSSFLINMRAADSQLLGENYARLCNVLEMSRCTTSMNRCVIFYTILFYYSVTKKRKRFDTLAYLLLPAEFADLNADVSKVFARDREKKSYASLFQKGETSLFHNKGRSFNDFNASNSRAIISAF